MICKYPPIQGGVSADSYWTAQLFTEMGHEVHVITNSEEVEDTYKVSMTPQDQSLLSGYRIPNSITVHSTYTDKHHVFIPQNNPNVSKMVGIGLRVIEEIKPDFIWSYYFEPYGVVALFLSKITGVPYTVRHAGSDLGRLMLTEQLSSLYEQVLKNALIVLTHSRHHETLMKIGVKNENIIYACSPRLPGDLFFPQLFHERGEKFILGIYGKAGPAKGTQELLEAMVILKNEKFPCLLKAHWGGKHMDTVRKKTEDGYLDDILEIKNFIPHWEIPKFIKSCNIIMFLENNFRIPFHGPGIPLESLSCGRPLIVSQEIFDKEVFRKILKNKENCFVVPCPITAESIALTIKDAHSCMFSRQFDDQEWTDSGLIGVQVRKGMETLLKLIHLKTRH